MQFLFHDHIPSNLVWVAFRKITLGYIKLGTSWIRLSGGSTCPFRLPKSEKWSGSIGYHANRISQEMLRSWKSHRCNVGQMEDHADGRQLSWKPFKWNIVIVVALTKCCVDNRALKMSCIWNYRGEEKTRKCVRTKHIRPQHRVQRSSNLILNFQHWSPAEVLLIFLKLIFWKHSVGINNRFTHDFKALPSFIYPHLIRHICIKYTRHDLSFIG